MTDRGKVRATATPAGTRIRLGEWLTARQPMVNSGSVIVLALDTTTRAGSVALLQEGRVLVTRSGTTEKGHAERLPAALIDALREAGLAIRQVDVFAVASGPGSFTGLRIGIATIQGLAFALGRPVVGVSVLDALAVLARDHAALAPRHSPLLAAAFMDAQRHEVFAALYPAEGDLVPLDGPVSEPPNSVLTRWSELAENRPILVAGDGIDRYRSLLVEHLGSRFHAVDPLPPLAPTIASLAAAEAAAGRAVAPHAVRPVYVRRPDAELARERKEPSASKAP